MPDYFVESVVARTGQKSTVKWAELPKSVLAIIGVAAISLARLHVHSRQVLDLHFGPDTVPC